MSRHVCIGSQLYINGNESTDELRTLVQKMKGAGLSLIRLFMTRDLLEPSSAGRWDFSRFDTIFDEAARLGLGVVPTLMAETAHGYMRLTTSGQDLYDLENPELWTNGLAYVDEVVRHYADHPALHSWILWNEPSRSITLQPSNIALFRTFLQKKYKDISDYNQCHYRKFESFEHLEQDYCSVRPSMVFQPYTDKMDLLDFTVQNLCEKLQGIKAHVRLWDKIHPVHINPHDIAGESYANGQNFFEEGKCVDFLGCSAHPSWHSMDFNKFRIPLSIAFFADVMKAASASERFWVTELQGGTNIFSGKGYLCPDEKDIGLYLAAGFGTGAEATVFWCFNTRNAGFEGGEWGLLNQLGEPSDRLQAASAFAQILREHQALFDASRPASPDVYILYSDNTIRLQMVETIFRSADGVRHKNNGKFSLIGAYEALTDLGYNPGFLSEEQLQNGKLPQGSTLILPDTYALEAETVSAIREFVLCGGTVLADGLIGMKTPEGVLDRASLQNVSEIFGAEVEDIFAQPEPFTIRDGDNRCTGEFLKLRFRLPDGTSTEDTIRNTFGNGHTIRIPGIIFRRYFREEDENILSFLRPLLPKKTGLHLENPQPHLVLRILESPQGDIGILTNESDTPVTAVLSENVPVTLFTAHKCSSQNDKTVIPLDARDFAIFQYPAKV